MRYFTAEWYRDTVLAEMCFQLRKTQKAVVFSEDFFQKLFKTEKKAYLKHSKRVAKFEKTEFDTSKAERKFEQSYLENLEFVQSNLPQSILSQVKDVRVLALGSADYDTAQEITRFCGQVNRRCEHVCDEYDKQLEKIAENIGWLKINSLNMLIGAPISSIALSDGAITVTTSSEYTGIAARVVLKNANVAESNENIVGTVIQKHELIYDDGTLSFGLLCIDECGEPQVFSAKMSDIEIEEIHNVI